MRKFILSILTVFSLFVNIYAVQPDIFSVGANDQLRVTDNGCLLSKSTDTRFADGTLTYQSWTDIATISSNTVFSRAITTGTLQGLTTGWTQAITQFVTPRNVTVGFDFSNYDVVPATQQINGTVKVSGISNKGKILTEVIIASNTEIAGNIAFVKVDTITFNVTFGYSTRQRCSGVHVNVGFGLKIGLCGNITATTDVIKLNEAGSNVLPSAATISAVYDTISFVSAPNASNDYWLWLNQKVLH